MNEQAFAVLVAFEHRSSLSLHDLGVLAGASWLDPLDAVNYLRRLNYIRVCGQTQPVPSDQPLPPLEMHTQMELTQWGRDALRRARREDQRDWRSRATLVIAAATLVATVVGIVVTVVLGTG